MSFIKLSRNIKNSKINEALIINVLIKNSKKIVNNEMTLSKIANECFISHSSVSRLLSKLGWSTWGEFTQSCIIEELFAKKASQGTNKALDIQKLKTNEWLVDNKNIIKNIARLIKKSNMIVFFGEKIAGNIAQYFSFLFSRKEIMTTHFFYEHEAISFLQKKSTLFLLATDNDYDLNRIINLAIKKDIYLVILHSTDDININKNKDFKSDHENIYYLEIPMVSYFNNLNTMFLMKCESIRSVGIEIFDKLK